MGDLRLKYSPVAMTFHWVIAALILVNYLLGWIFNGHALWWKWGEMRSPLGHLLTSWHMSIGIVILVLSVLRLVWRLITPQPQFAAHLKAWERALAHAVHWLLYVFMIGMPLMGWIMVSARPHHVPYAVFDWPRFPGFGGMPPAQLKPTERLFEHAHRSWFAWAGYVLIALHVTGALKHQLLDRDNELARMIPGLGTPGRRGIG